MYKLIATDLDGTLLNSNHKISKKNKEAIILSQEKGIKFVLASGRPITAMINFEKELKLADFSSYLIAYNGAQIYDCKNMKTIYSTPLNKKQINYIIEKSNYYNVPFVTYYNNTIYASNIDDNIMIEAKYTNMPIKKLSSIDEIDSSNLLKFMFISEPEKISNIFKELNSEKNKDLSIAISDPHFLEIMDNKANKGLALKTLCNITNIKLEEVISCGDSYNDIPMLEISGLSVAAMNANNTVKKLCKYISVKNDEDILDDVIKKFALNT